VQNRTDHWLKAEGEQRHPLVDLLNPLLTQDDVLQLGLPSVFGRPSWARRTWREGGTWWTELDWPSPGGEPVVLRSTGPRAKGVKLQGRRAWWAAEQRGELAGGEWAIGADGQQGLYLNLTIQGITQRMRWMEPGTFLMGSPEGQGNGDEHPQHPVTLRQGFWLADAPCTQALWQALMGDNPSEFKTGEDADQRPVEKVSYEDVEAFNAKLSQALPTGWQADLPTEAEWEYACRAGTSTAYWWGDNPTTAKPTGTNSRTAPRPSRSTPPTLGACTTCTAMCGNGARTTHESIRVRRSMTLWATPKVTPAWFAAARGSTTPTAPARPAATGGTWATASATWASALP
jgi:hypothetical protein